MINVLYLSLTGMTEPLGRSQILEYLIELGKENKIYLISFERRNDLDNTAQIQELIDKNQIEWTYLTYSNKYGVFSSILQILQAIHLGSKIIKANSIDIVHARSMIPATMGLLLKNMQGVKLLFDIRGFAIDEKVDSGRLRKGSLLFKILKKLDDYLYQSSDHIVTLTLSAKEILQKQLNIPADKITVIPTCANKKIFKLISKREKQFLRESLNFNMRDKIIIHTGTVSNRYDFSAEVELFKVLLSLDNNFKFLIVNKGEHEFIRNTLLKQGVEEETFSITSSSFDEVYQYLNIADIALFFIPPSHAKHAMAPTKFAENVACLLPSITNIGVGDMGYYLDQYDVGYVVDLVSLKDNIEMIAKNVMKKISQHDFSQKDFNILFEEHFDKKIAIRKYQKIYDQI